MTLTPPATTDAGFIEASSTDDDVAMEQKINMTDEKAQELRPEASTAAPGSVVGPPPDGGLWAWLQVVAGHLVVFNVWGYTISYGIFQPYYVETLNLGPSAVSWIGSMQTCLIFLVGSFSGRAFDAGYLRSVLAAGLLMQLVGIFTTSVSTKYWELFLAQGLCQGIGCGLTFAPTIAHVSTYFSKKRMLALASAACGGATGGVIFPLIAQQLMPKIGFGWTVRAMGLVVLVASGIILLLVRPRLLPRKSAALVEWAAFKEATYVDYARSYSIDRLHGSQSTSFNMLMIINVVGVPGRLIPAYLADRYFGAVNVFIPTIIGTAICIFAWAGVDSISGDYAWVAFFGYFGAGVQALFPATTASLTKDLSKAGIRIGMIFSIISVAALTGPPLAGKLIAVSNGRYIGSQIWGGVCLLIGAAFLMAARWTKERELRSKEDVASA